MNLPTFDPFARYPVALEQHRQQVIDAGTLQASRTHVEREIRDAIEYGIRESLGTVPAALPFDDGVIVYSRVELSFASALRDALADVEVMAKVLAAMNEPNPAAAKRKLDRAEEAIVQFHIAAHAPRLAKLHAFPHLGGSTQ